MEGGVAVRVEVGVEVEERVEVGEGERSGLPGFLKIPEKAGPGYQPVVSIVGIQLVYQRRAKVSI